MGRSKIWTEQDLLIALDVYWVLYWEQGVKLNGKTLDASPYFQRAARLIDDLRVPHGMPKANRGCFKTYIMGFASYYESCPTDGTSVEKSSIGLSGNPMRVMLICDSCI